MGEVFGGRYELLDVIGSGGMGTVWRARDLRTDAVVAAKVLRQSDAGSLLRFIRETGFRIHHPNVLVPLGWAGEDDRVVLAMPIVDGGSVATLVGDHGALPPLLVAELLRQLFGALDAVHAAGVVHRDVKPANLLLRATGTGRPHLLLSDFGIATEIEGPRLTQANLVIGTRGYLAPEQLEGADPHPTHDLFAAGMVAREMLTAERPRTEGPVPLVTDERPPGVPHALWQLVVALTRLDPGARPASAAQCLERLADPALVWTPDAIGEVDVLDQISPDALGEGGLPTATRIAPGREVSTQVQTSPDAASLPTEAVAAAPTLVAPAEQTQLVTPAPTRPEPARQQPAPTRPGPVQPAVVEPTGPAPVAGSEDQPERTAERPPAPLNGAIPLILAFLFVLGLLIALASWHPWTASALPAGGIPAPRIALRL